MRDIGRAHPKGTIGRRLEIDEVAGGAPSSTTTTLFARETALLAGERAADLREAAADLRDEAADRREAAADLRDEAADRREEVMRAAAKLRAHKEAQLVEANEHLVVAAIHSQTMTDVAEQAALEMSFKAERDFLTGLPNRALLTDRLAQSIALAQRHGTRVALMYLDLDNFKDINDLHGHSVGDQLLQSTARRLEGCIRHSDTVSRQGGDEFVVLLTEILAAHDADLAAEKLIRAMAEPYFIGGHRLYVTLSIGVSLYPDDGADAEAVLTNADTAMYHAKRNGRNSYRRFHPEMNATSVARQFQ